MLTVLLPCLMCLILGVLFGFVVCAVWFGIEMVRPDHRARMEQENARV